MIAWHPHHYWCIKMPSGSEASPELEPQKADDVAASDGEWRDLITSYAAAHCCKSSLKVGINELIGIWMNYIWITTKWHWWAHLTIWNSPAHPTAFRNSKNSCHSWQVAGPQPGEAPLCRFRRGLTRRPLWRPWLLQPLWNLWAPCSSVRIKHWRKT